MILGVTGGLGCGKTTAAVSIAARGFLRLDSDALVRETVLTAPATLAALRSRYGAAVFTASGAIDRPALARIVFAQDEERHWLEDLTHPPVFELWRSALRERAGANWVIEVPLLFEKALENWFDFTVCVACDASSQLTRLEQRGLTRELAGQRISKQLPLARKVELSDFVLWNDGSAAFLQAQVDRVVDSLV
jgi:dephospho-CoA kinase